MRNALVLALDVAGSSVKSALVAESPDIVGSVCVAEIQSTGSSTAITHTLATIIPVISRKRGR